MIPPALLAHGVNLARAYIVLGGYVVAGLVLWGLLRWLAPPTRNAPAYVRPLVACLHCGDTGATTPFAQMLAAGTCEGLPCAACGLSEYEPVPRDWADPRAPTPH